jgi:hypothetical protein
VKIELLIFIYTTKHFLISEKTFAPGSLPNFIIHKETFHQIAQCTPVHRTQTGRGCSSILQGSLDATYESPQSSHRWGRGVERLHCKRPIPICRLFFKIDLLTDIAALCLSDFIDWRYIHSFGWYFRPSL